MRSLLAFIFLTGLSSTVVAQSNIKESSNSFARYTKTGEVKNLESAKNFIDAAYKTKRDTVATRNNIMRALIYSSLAFADSTRKIKTPKDPIIIAKAALTKIKPKELGNYDSEVKYINQNLSAAYIYKANQHIAKKEFDQAYTNFLEVEKLGINSIDVLNNLALLAKQAGKTDDAIGYYDRIIKTTDADVTKHLVLAELYKTKNNEQLYLNTLQDARQKFPNDKNVAFLLLQVFVESKSYAAASPLLDDVVKNDPNNTEILYLAGFVSENVGNIPAAKKYYEKTLEIETNNFDANLALGLIYLNQFLGEKSNLEAQYSAQNYLLSANGIKPYSLNTLKGLALFYEASEDLEQLDRVNILLNQLSNN